MLLFTSCRLHHSIKCNQVTQKEDEGTCRYCIHQGTGDTVCTKCTRNDYAIKKSQDYFKLRA